MTEWLYAYFVYYLGTLPENRQKTHAIKTGHISLSICLLRKVIFCVKKVHLCAYFGIGCKCGEGALYQYTNEAFREINKI